MAAMYRATGSDNHPDDHAGRPPGNDTVRAAADPAVVGPWLARALAEPSWAHCRIARLGSGRSNLTFRVDSAAGSVVLRRPPLGAVAASAHDMGREQRALRALQGTAVPVPAVLAATDESGPLGTPCYVMEFVEGIVAVHDLPTGFAEHPEQRRDIGYGLVDVLAELHAVDPAAVGLGDFGRPEGFLERQLRTWARQLDIWRDGQHWPALTALADALRAQLPGSGSATIVHGDYRIDNLVLDRADPGRVRAVLDWEMATLGDPLADLGLMLASWQHAEEDDGTWIEARVLPSPTALSGFPTRAAMAARYVARSGRSSEELRPELPPELPWYIALGCFKLAVVLMGIVFRVRAGAAPADTAIGMREGISPLAGLGNHVLRTGRF